MRRGMMTSLVMVAALALIAWRGRTEQVQWEYNEVELSSTVSGKPTLDRFGANGWELVGVISGCPGTVSYCKYWAYFKRPK